MEFDFTEKEGNLTKYISGSKRSTTFALRVSNCVSNLASQENVNAGIFLQVAASLNVP